MARIGWVDLFVSMARLVALRSPDTSCKLGSIIVSTDNRILSTGYNGWPRGINAFEHDDPRWERPNKYNWMAHAERNAIDNACLAGISPAGASIYSMLAPCADCARGIIQTGIKRVYIDKACQDIYADRLPSGNTWFDGVYVGRQMLIEAGVRVFTAEVLNHTDNVFLAGGWHRVKSAETIQTTRVLELSL